MPRLVVAQLIASTALVLAASSDVSAPITRSTYSPTSFKSTGCFSSSLLSGDAGVASTDSDPCPLARRQRALSNLAPTEVARVRHAPSLPVRPNATGRVLCRAFHSPYTAPHCHTTHYPSKVYYSETLTVNTEHDFNHSSYYVSHRSRLRRRDRSQDPRQENCSLANNISTPLALTQCFFVNDKRVPNCVIQCQ